MQAYPDCHGCDHQGRAGCDHKHAGFGHDIAFSVAASSAVIYPFVTALSVCVSVSRPCFLMLSKKGYIALVIAYTPVNAMIASSIAAILSSCVGAVLATGSGMVTRAHRC
ncbi:MAG: hypothetical protein PHD55_04795 [Methanoregula sp.]|nr:hypothetical protein [Methanoregula sp.]